MDDTRVILLILSDPDRPLQPLHYYHLYTSVATKLLGLWLDVDPDPAAGVGTHHLRYFAARDFAIAVSPDRRRSLVSGDVYVTDQIPALVLHLFDGAGPSRAYFGHPPESDLPRQGNYILFVVRHQRSAQMHLVPRDDELAIYYVGGRVLTRAGAPEFWPRISTLLCGADETDLTFPEQITVPKFFGLLPQRCMVNTVAICIE